MQCRAIPYEGNEPYIFISYCHKDMSELHSIFEQIVLAGYRIWYDDGNHAGDDWLDNLEDHLENCRVVLAFISENSSLSHNCKSEIVYALKCKKKVIPVLIDDADLPKGLRMQLSYLQYLRNADFSSPDALLRKVFEVDECSGCQAPAGTLKLKEVSPTPFACNTAAGEGNCFEEQSAPRIAVPDNNNAHYKGSNSSLSGKGRIIRVHVKKPVEPTSPAPAAENNNSQEDNKSDTYHQEACSDAFPESAGSETSQSELEESTVYDQGLSDKTVLGTPAVDDDGEETIRVGFSPALLLHLAENRIYILTKPQTKIGRSPIKCDVVIEGNNSISKHHADIIQYNGKAFLCDANSANGTFVKGTQLDPGNQIMLDNPAVFRLNDEVLVFIMGHLAREFISQKRMSLLINEEKTAVRLMDSNKILLNRNNKWPDGTLSDSKIHRAAHAFLAKQGDSIYLTDDSPEGGNGTYVNGQRLNLGASELLSSGDHIRLGDTTLQFLSIAF